MLYILCPVALGRPRRPVDDRERSPGQPDPSRLCTDHPATTPRSGRRPRTSGAVRIAPTTAAVSEDRLQRRRPYQSSQICKIKISSRKHTILNLSRDPGTPPRPRGGRGMICVHPVWTSLTGGAFPAVRRPPGAPQSRRA